MESWRLSYKDDKDCGYFMGKRKDLKSAPSSYRKNLSSKKTEALVSSIHHIDTTITLLETESIIA